MAQAVVLMVSSKHEIVVVVLLSTGEGKEVQLQTQAWYVSSTGTSSECLTVHVENTF